MPNSKDFNHFAYNPVDVNISRSLFNMDHSVKFSCNVGEVIPFELTEVLPGDTFTVDTTKVVRLQPLVAPIMDEVIQDVYFFFCPLRLIWNHFVNFMGENTSSAWAPSVEYQIPQLNCPENGFDVGTIADYLGVPPKAEGGAINALPFRAYALICDQWFRSEAVMDPVHVFVDDVTRTGSNGNNQVTDIELGGKPFIACKFFDYFTGALPSPQRGDPVNLQIARGGTFPVESLNTINYDFPFENGKTIDPNKRGIHFTYTAPDNNTYQNVPDSRYIGSVDGYGSIGAGNASLGSPRQLFIDNLGVTIPTSSFQTVTINDLRTAFAMQKYLEKQARYGGRYTEFVKGFFNVDSPDARLQRTEYLGGSRVSLNINSVEQTSATTSNSTPLGNVAGMSVTADSNSDFTKSFTEHGYLIGVSVLRYHHSYQQSLDRLWTRHTPYDFYNPVFANLGEQEIKLCELYFTDDGNQNSVFGYQERWAEYRYKPNRIAGEMRSVSSTPLDMWHLGDFYTSRPYLSPEWLREDKTMLDRCLAVTSDVSNQCICDFYIKMEASRAMPLYSIPGLIDHH